MLRTNELLLAAAGLSGAACQRDAAQALRLPAAACALAVRMAPVTLASAPGERAALANDSLVGFLAFLALLLVLALIAIVRLEPPERQPAAEDAAPAAGPAFRAPVLPPPALGQRPAAAVPLPVRTPGQSDQRGYAARHAPGTAPDQRIAERPRVSGGPPWGPAPRPPDVGPFVRSPD